MLCVKKSGFRRSTIQAALTEVVRATFDQLNAEIQACRTLQEGEVLTDQLLLQIDGVGGNYNF